jgi:hypothetical protein
MITQVLLFSLFSFPLIHLIEGNSRCF